MPSDTGMDPRVPQKRTRTSARVEGGQRIGNLFYGTKGWLWIDGDGHSWQSYFGRKNEKGPGADLP